MPLWPREFSDLEAWPQTFPWVEGKYTEHYSDSWVSNVWSNGADANPSRRGRMSLVLSWDLHHPLPPLTGVQSWQVPEYREGRLTEDQAPWLDLCPQWGDIVPNSVVILESGTLLKANSINSWVHQGRCWLNVSLTLSLVPVCDEQTLAPVSSGK